MKAQEHIIGREGGQMIVAQSIKEKILVTIDNQTLATKGFRIERKSNIDDLWRVWTGKDFCIVTDNQQGNLQSGSLALTPTKIFGIDFLDVTQKQKGLYAYRFIDFDIDVASATQEDYEYSNWVRVRDDQQIGYSFGNYKVPQGQWGCIVTEDDMRYTYLWGTDFKANNGQSYTDAQIKYFIDASVKDIERKLDITIKKQRIRYNAKERGLVKDKDYDTEEAVYDFRYAKISRYGLIKTRQRPILELHTLKLLSRLEGINDLKDTTIVDKTKGLLKLMARPLKPSETTQGIQQAIGVYGNQTMNAHLFYAIDYDAGYETSDDVPQDLREVIAKNAAVNLLNVIGDGLMSGFSSSSLSMDGVSESFSSTQSATSAYFGARIKEYKDDIDAYIKAVKGKFGHLAIGCL